MVEPWENLYRWLRWDETLSGCDLLERIAESGADGSVADLLVGGLAERPFVTREDLFEFNNIRYAVLDLETTGGKMADNRIIEIGIVVARGTETLAEYSQLVNPHSPVHPFVWNLTGITPDELKTAPLLEEVIDDVVHLLDGIPLFAHNVSFDKNVINAEMDRLGRPGWDDWFCTVDWSRRLLPGLERYKLGSLARQFGLGLHNAHRALDDARATKELVCLLARQSAEQTWDLFHLLHAFRAGRIKKKEISEIWVAESVHNGSA